MVTEHEERVNQFIGQAVQEADTVVGKTDCKTGKMPKDKADAWNRVYFAAMDRMTIAAGLRFNKKQ